MPNNRAVDRLRFRRSFKCAIPVALVATPAYLGLTALAIEFAANPGLGFLSVLVFLLFWNAAKFAWMAVLSLTLMLGQPVRALRSAHPWQVSRTVTRRATSLTPSGWFPKAGHRGRSARWPSYP